MHSEDLRPGRAPSPIFTIARQETAQTIEDIPLPGMEIYKLKGDRRKIRVSR
jgi:hypothetical protein